MVGLGFGLSLASIVRVGARSAAYTVVGIALTLAAGSLLGRLAGTSGPLSTLISIGTAICGGSAIAAMAPVVKAKSDEIAVSLATVFTLNAAALLLAVARQSLVLTLFLIGTGLTRDVLRRVGVRPLRAGDDPLAPRERGDARGDRLGPHPGPLRGRRARLDGLAPVTPAGSCPEGPTRNADPASGRRTWGRTGAR